MAVALYNVTRVNDAEATGTLWTAISGSATSEGEFVYQNSKSVSFKVKTTENGVKYYDSGTSHAYSTGPKMALLKLIVTTPFNLNATASTSMIAEIGSGNRANYYRYYIATDTTYPPGESWLIRLIDPNVTQWRDATVLSPNLAAVDYYAVASTMKTTAAKSENTAMDAIDFLNAPGSGLEWTGTSGNFTSFLTFDEGTQNNRYGIIQSKNGILYVRGFLRVGDSGATATTFTSSSRVIVFPDERVTTGAVGTYWYLNNAGNAITMTDVSFIGRGALYTSDDTRPDHTFEGTTAGAAATLTRHNFNTFRNITFTDKVTADSCVFANGLRVVQAGATISDCVFSGATTGDGVAHVLSNNPTLISGCDFTFSDGHAIELNTAGSFTLTNNTYTGYGGNGTNDAVIYNNSGGAVTLNISGGDSPTVRNGAGASTDVVATVPVDIHVEDESGTAIQGAQVYIQRATPTNFTSGAGNNAGDGDLVVTQTIDADAQAVGRLIVYDRSADEIMPYRYASHDAANTFTFPTEVTGSATSTGSGTSLISTSTNFLTADIQEGDTIRNTTDGSWAVVDEIVDADNVTTTPLQGGGDNTWQASDAFSLHKLAVTLVSGTDTVDNPLLNTQTNASGNVSLSYRKSEAPTDVVIRVRSNEGGTKYIPYRTTGTILAASGLSVNVILLKDTVAA